MRSFVQYIKVRLDSASLWAIVKVLALLLVVVISDFVFVIEVFKVQSTVGLLFIFGRAAYTVAILAVVFVGSIIIASIPYSARTSRQDWAFVGVCLGIAYTVGNLAGAYLARIGSSGTDAFICSLFTTWSFMIAVGMTLAIGNGYRLAITNGMSYHMPRIRFGDYILQVIFQFGMAWSITFYGGYGMVEALIVGVIAALVGVGGQQYTLPSMMFSFLVAVGGVELFVLPVFFSPILAGMILVTNFALYPIWAWVRGRIWNRRIERRYGTEVV